MLKFTKPSLKPARDRNFSSARFNIFAAFVRGNRIPKITGRPGQLVKLKFDKRRKEFGKLVDNYEYSPEVRISWTREDDASNGSMDKKVSSETEGSDGAMETVECQGEAKVDSPQSCGETA